MIGSVLLLLCFVFVCEAALTIQNKEVNPYGSADAGNFLGFPNDVSSTFVADYQGAFDNTAKASEDASSGNRLFFGGSAAITNSGFYVAQGSVFNKAKSDSNNAVAGTQSVFSNVENYSDVGRFGFSGFNTAIVGSDNATTSNPAAIAGTQTQVGSVDSSIFGTFDLAYNNKAVNKQTGGGEAVAGIENAVGTVDNSVIDLYSGSTANEAISKGGVASSGVENQLADVTDSTVYLTSTADYNTAKSNGDNAVAGVQDTIGSVAGSFPGGGSSVFIDQVATNNEATSKNGGSAVSGAVTNIESAYRSDVDVYTDAYNNYAKTTGSGTGSSDAVSGVAVTVSDIEDSVLTIDSLSFSNTAVNKASSASDPLGNDAVSGTQVNIGNAEDSTVAIVAGSYDNVAEAKNGDAVAGNQINIGDTDSSTFVSLDLNSAGNVATSTNGVAVIDNDVNIGGDANVIGYP
eukprot:TRINITY_DN937_c0_g1_i4.p1 TRINITY_DN937_c0_g1~~TRINITY_DN937_c0_g1_i4.p1  ORF type:complete len:460 (-),score=104.31 TRINITY_DN937_c0_g1_i4:1273-2652(-)